MNEVFWPSDDRSFPNFPIKVQRVEDSLGGAELLGSPMFRSDSFFMSSTAKRIDKVLLCRNHLQDLQDPQVELHLLRTCLSICKINHLLRTVSHDKISLQLSRFDNGMHKCLERSSRSSLPDSAWSQATLPIRFGGLGLREACNSYSAAFIGSCNSTRDLSCQLLKTFVSSFVAEEATVSSNHSDLIVSGELQSREHLNSILPANSTICLTTSKQHDIQVILDSSLQS